MKLRRNKKGFTIIELVIVIAVIGILAAVLIPTFVNLTNKANEAADNALVNNLNKALKMEEQEAGHQKAPTLEGAIKDLEDQGYILENLASKSGKDLLWSQSENQFLLNTEGKSGKDYWKIVDAVPTNLDDQKYSYYAGKNFNQTDVTVKYGFDAGRIDNIAKVTYKGTGSAQEVAIRTNSVETNLTVNAPLDTVHHYDNLSDLTITAIAGASYHEHGIISGKAVISKGHIEVEKNAVVPAISVAAATGEVKVTANEKTTVMVDAASAATTSVVANAENVNVAGLDAEKISGDKASTVVEATKVMNESELYTAFYNDKPFVQLGADIELTSNKCIWAETKFDLNGHTVTVPANLSLGFIPLSKTELFDSVGTGKIVGAGLGNKDGQILVYAYPDATFVMNGGELKNSGQYGIFASDGDVTVNSGKITDCQYGIFGRYSKVEINNVKITGSTWGVVIVGNGNNGSAQLVINGGEINGEYAVSGNGNANSSGTIIEINGGKLTGTDLGLYHPQNGTLKIKGNPEITGKTALYIKSGTSTILGGKFVATLTPKADYNYNGNGGTPTGDAIVIDACNYPGGNPCVEAEISSASFSLADTSAKRVAYYSHDNGAAVVIVDGQTLQPIIG